MFNITPTVLKDVVERAIRSFIGVFVPMLIAGGVFDADTFLGSTDLWESAAVAGLAAAGSVVLAFIFGTFGPKNGTTSVVADVVDAEVIRALPPHIPEP